METHEREVLGKKREILKALFGKLESGCVTFYGFCTSREKRERKR